MIFLIEYNRLNGKLVTFQAFAESEYKDAETLRLALELDLRRKSIDHEIVLLEAENEAALRRTHRRYFEDLRQLLDTPLPGSIDGNVATTGG